MTSHVGLGMRFLPYILLQRGASYLWHAQDGGTQWLNHCNDSSGSVSLQQSPAKRAVQVRRECLVLDRSEK